eukprot:COSAG06_NODE_38176_length_426_cov_1.100917_1_plen_29_part_10
MRREARVGKLTEERQVVACREHRVVVLPW